MVAIKIKPNLHAKPYFQKKKKNCVKYQLDKIFNSQFLIKNILVNYNLPTTNLIKVADKMARL